jgi:hypothetical protein
MPLHERTEQVFSLPRHVGVVLFHRHHGHSGVGIHRYHVSDRRPKWKPLDAAIEFFREQQRRVQG